MGRKLTPNGWKTKMEHLMRDLIIKEQKGKCFLGCGRKATVADHLFSRTKLRLFFMRENLNAICQECHTNKTFNNTDASATLFFKTRERLGAEKWNHLLDVLFIKKPFPEFKEKWWREGIEKALTSGKYPELKFDK